MTAPAPRRAPRGTYDAVNAIGYGRVAQLLGLTPAPKAGRGFFACVACASSDALHATPRGGFKCHSCGEGFSNVDAAAAVWGLSPSDACLELARRLSVYVPDASPIGTHAGRGADARAAGKLGAILGGRANPGDGRKAGKGGNPPEKPQEIPRAGPLDRLRAHGCVPCEPPAVYRAALDALQLGAVGRAYLAGRGFDVDAAEAYGFRAIDGPAGWAALRDALADSFTLDELEAAGFARAQPIATPKKRTETPDLSPVARWAPPWGGRVPALAIPYWHAGALVALRFRNLDPRAESATRYRTLGGTHPPVPFNADALDGGGRFAAVREKGASELHVVEGELNAYALTLHGLRAIGLPGAQTWRAEWTPRLATVGRVCLWYDDDPPKTLSDGRTVPGAGARARGALVETLAKAYHGPWVRAHVREVTIPREADGRVLDTNDLHRDGRLAPFLALVRRQLEPEGGC